MQRMRTRGRLAGQIAAILLISLTAGAAGAGGLPVAKYLEDPEHKNDIIGFYLDAVFTGINLANQRIKPPLFCMSSNDPESAFDAIDRRITSLEREKKLSPDMTVDEIMLDILMSEYPCKQE